MLLLLFKWQCTHMYVHGWCEVWWTESKYYVHGDKFVILIGLAFWHAVRENWFSPSGKNSQSDRPTVRPPRWRMWDEVEWICSLQLHWPRATCAGVCVSVMEWAHFSRFIISCWFPSCACKRPINSFLRRRATTTLREIDAAKSSKA